MAAFEPIQSFSSPLWKWYCEPDKEWKDSLIDGNREGRDGWWKIDSGGKLLLAPPAKKDFWRKTYYEPLLVKDDGSFLYSLVPETALPVTIETSFSLTPHAQFDQAGIILRIDRDHWIKTGIEVVDGKPRLSCVVTNGFSDWSTQDWKTPGVQIRLHLLPQHGGSFVVEGRPLSSTNESRDAEEEWSFVRIAHMNRGFSDGSLANDPKVTSAFEGPSAPPGTLMVGVFAACPVDQIGMVATFDRISITKGSSFVHDA